MTCDATSKMNNMFISSLLLSNNIFLVPKESHSYRDKICI